MAHERRTKFYRLSQNVITYLTERQGMTLSRIAEMIDVDKSFVTRVKQGTRELSTTHLHALADAHGLPLGAFLLATERPGKVPERHRELYDLAEKVVRAADRVEQAAKVEQAAEVAKTKSSATRAAG